MTASPLRARPRAARFRPGAGFSSALRPRLLPTQERCVPSFTSPHTGQKAKSYAALSREQPPGEGFARHCTSVFAARALAKGAVRAVAGRPFPVIVAARVRFIRGITSPAIRAGVFRVAALRAGGRDGGSLISVPRHSQSRLLHKDFAAYGATLARRQAGAGAGGRNAGNRHLDVALGFAHGNRDRIAHFVAAVALYIILRGLGAGGDAGQFVGSLVRKAVFSGLPTATVAVSLTSSQRSHCT